MAKRKLPPQDDQPSEPEQPAPEPQSETARVLEEIRQDQARDDSAIFEYDASKRSGRVEIGGWNAHVLIVFLGIGIVLGCVALVIASIAYLAVSIGFRLGDVGAIILWLILSFCCWWRLPPAH